MLRMISRLLGARALLVALVVAGSAASSAGAADRVKADVGYMPILPDAQLFVGLKDGSIAKAGLDPHLISFQNGPAMVQALLSGQLDIAYFGIGPAMVARARGAKLRVVASNIIEQISFIALGDLAPYFDTGDPSTAFARFARDKGRKARISTFPTGSVPQTVLQYWLRNTLHAKADGLDIISQGTAQVQQSLLTGAVDGAAILEPVVSIVEARRPDARVVASGADMFKDQPGAVLAVRESFIKAHPDVVRKLVAAHIAATQKLRAADPSAIDAVSQYVGGGRLPRPIVATAIKHSQTHFVANPHRIIDGTRRMYLFQKKLGTLHAKIDIKTLFDTDFYDQDTADSARSSDKP